MSDRVQILLFGSQGRMGLAIADVIAAAPGLELCGTADADRVPGAGTADVVIDFSSPNGADEALAWALQHKAAFVCGTTGLEAPFFARLTEASANIPVLYAANMSLGVNVMLHLVEEAARMLPESFDAEIVELHHRRKVDSPSGTALALLESLNRGRDKAPREDALFERSGLVGARAQGEIGVFGVRGGTVAGDHTVYFLGDDERVELRHQANDRRIFARGAVQAARWIAGKQAGTYSMKHVLGLAG